MQKLELGLDTFGDVTAGLDGSQLTQAQVIRNLVEEGVLADRLGVDFIGVGEHHRPDIAVSAPEVVLGALAARTQRLKLGTAVTVLSTDDPVRVYERFATLDAISGGRAEIILGRGSFIESFKLFGYDLENYDALFEERVELWDELLKEGPLHWSGATRAPLDGQRAYPVTEGGGVKTWIGVGGSPESIVRAARYGFPLVLAIIGGPPLRFAPLVELYREALRRLGRPDDLPVGVHSPGHVAETDEQAREQLWPHYQEMFGRIGRERGWPPVTREQFDAAAGPDGPLLVGSPETVAAKMVAVSRALGLARYSLKYSNGRLPHELLLRSIELYATRVIPEVRKALAQPPA